MKWFSKFSVRMFGILLFLAALVVAVVGFLNQHYGLLHIKPFDGFIADFYANLSTEFIGIAITVLVIDQLYERSKIQKIKEQLIRQMGFADNDLARLAVDELRIYGSLGDGSLRKVSFCQANLSRALLFSADLEQSDFSRAILHNADLKWSNLQNANLNSAFLENSLLIGANLSGSCLSQAILRGAYLIDTNLQNADLQGAVLTCACFWGANLRGALVSEAQLRETIMLSGAVMPDGSIYDGEFNLKGDITLASEPNPIDDTLVNDDKLPGVVRDNEIHARQFLRWKWVSEKIMST